MFATLFTLGIQNPLLTLKARALKEGVIIQSTLTELTQLLPAIILYLVSGFLYLQIFHFIATVQNPNDFQNLFVKSLIVGFILYSCASIVPFRTANYYLNVVIFLCVCCLLAYTCGRIYLSVRFKQILSKLGILRTVNPYIWNDLVDVSATSKALWIYIEFNEPHISYYGLLSTYEDFQRQPLIVLSCYTKIDYSVPSNNREYASDATKRVLLDTSKASIIELIYEEESENIRELKQVLDNYNRQ